MHHYLVNINRAELWYLYFWRVSESVFDLFDSPILNELDIIQKQTLGSSPQYLFNKLITIYLYKLNEYVGGGKQY